MSLSEILENTLSADKDIREKAQQTVSQFGQENVPNFFLELARMLASTKEKSIVRCAAAVMMKNNIYSKDPAQNKFLAGKWMDIPCDQREVIKATVVECLGTETWRPSSAAMVISVIAAIEFREIQWYDLVDTLYKKLNQANTDGLKDADMFMQAILDCIGYMCQDIQPTMMAAYVETILMCIEIGMSQSNKYPNVHLSAVKCFYSVLDATMDNFKDQKQRNYMMKWLFDSVNSSDMHIVVATLQCFVKICSVFYEYIDDYMGHGLFEITVRAIENNNPEVSLQGIEFWSNICDVESDMMAENDNYSEFEQFGRKQSNMFCLKAMDIILPILIKKIIKTDDEIGIDEWTPQKSAGVCLMLFTDAVGPPIVEKVFPFIQENIMSENWTFQEAAVYTLGSIIQTITIPVIKQIVQEALNPLISLLGNNHCSIRDTTAWVIGRIFEMVPGSTSHEETTSRALLALLSCLSDKELSVATNACWAINSLARSVHQQSLNSLGEKTSPLPTYALSPFFRQTVQELIKVLDRPDAIHSNLINASCECVSGLVHTAAEDCYDMVSETLLFVIKRLDTVLTFHQNGQIDVSTASDIQTQLCFILQSGLVKIKPQQVQSACDQVMTLMLKVFSVQSFGNAPCFEDALLVVDVVLSLLKEDFLKYMPMIHIVITKGLMDPSVKYLCLTAIVVTCSLAQILGEKAVVYFDDYVKCFIEILDTPALHHEICSSLITSIGDVAISLNDHFVKYVDAILPALLRRISSKPNQFDMYETECAADIREASLETFSGIMHCIKIKEQISNSNNFLVGYADYMPHLIKFIEDITVDHYKSDGSLKSTIALFGDMCGSFGRLMVPYLNNAPINNAIRISRESLDKDLKNTAVYASKEMRKLGLHA